MVFKKPIHFIFISISLWALNAAAGQFDPNQMIDLEKMRPKGTWEEVTWPDTLDLAARAELSLNVLTRNSDAASTDSVYQTFNFRPESSGDGGARLVHQSPEPLFAPLPSHDLRQRRRIGRRMRHDEDDAQAD